MSVEPLPSEPGQAQVKTDTQANAKPHVGLTRQHAVIWNDGLTDLQNSEPKKDHPPMKRIPRKGRTRQTTIVWDPKDHLLKEIEICYNMQVGLQ